MRSVLTLSNLSSTPQHLGRSKDLSIPNSPRVAHSAASIRDRDGPNTTDQTGASNNCPVRFGRYDLNLRGTRGRPGGRISDRNGTTGYWENLEIAVG